LSDGIGVVGIRSVLTCIIRVAAAIAIVLTRIVATRITVGAVLAAGKSGVWLRVERDLRVHPTRRPILARFDTGKINDYVKVVDQVAGAVECQLGIAAKHYLGVERLLDGLHSKVSVTGVSESPESDGGVLGEVLVRGSKSDELGQGSSLRGSDRTTSHDFRFFIAAEKKSSDEAPALNASSF
jgi:hypothetical protein